MESGTIKDSQITASSETENGTRDQSRLNAGPEKAWCVQESDQVRTLTIDLQKEYSITQVRVLTARALSRRDVNCSFVMIKPSDRTSRHNHSTDQSKIRNLIGYACAVPIDR